MVQNDYLKDLIEKAKKSPKKPDADFAFTEDEGMGIPPAGPGEQSGEEDLERKISAVREGLKKELGDEFEPAQKRQQAVPKAKPAAFERPVAEKEPEITDAESIFDDFEKPPELARPQVQTPRKKIEDALEIPPAEEGPPEQPMSSAENAIEGTELESETQKMFESANKIEVESYGNGIKIYKIPGEKLLYYYVPVPRPTGSEKRIIRTIKEAATRLITISPYKIRDPEQRRSVYRQRILDILQSAPEIQIPKGKMNFYTEAVIREMVGYGLIDQLVRDDRLEEIMITGDKKPVFVFHRDYEMMKTNIEFYTEEEVVDLINRVGREIGRRVDFSSPLLDARLPDGSRVNATIKPISVSGPTLTIRKFRADPFSIVDLVNFGTINTEVAAFLWLAVEGVETRPANILIAGGTGSGKTTLLNVLASFIPVTERVISIEDTAELNLPLEHWIRFEARPPGLENKGEITLDILTKNSLRMRPDRIMVGEIRHDEAFTLFTAMNTGHDGSLGTVHANTAQETLVRVTNPPMNVPETMLSGLNFILVENRLHDRKKGTIRRVTEISEVGGVLEGKAQVQAIYEWDAVKDDLRKTGVPCNYLRELGRLSGMTAQQLEKELKKRQLFLENMVKSKTRSITETSARMKSFLLAESEK
ncbi:MAG: CpaF family protein [Candidatus Diapherotrites archaeon]|nr:CpaF family protein [Candidatus Diapherotrites archaeon]